MASLHKHVTLTEDACPIPGHRKWQSSLTNYIMNTIKKGCSTQSIINLASDLLEILLQSSRKIKY